MKNLFLLLILSTISSCLFQKVAGTSHDTESTNEISLTGRVIDENNDPVKGVIVSLSKKGISDTTGENGRYHIMKEKIENDSGFVEGQGVLDTLNFIQDSQVVANINITKWIDSLPDVKIVQRDISGKLEGTHQNIGKVESVLKGDGIPKDDSIVSVFFYNELANNYSGFVYFPAADTVQTYSVYINVYADNGNFIGRSEIVPFNSLAGDITIPDFDPKNAIPVVMAGSDITLSINDTLNLQPIATDLFGGNIEKWEWDIGGDGNFIEIPNGDTSIVLPKESNSSYICILKVTDNDQNVKFDSLIVNVALDVPTAEIVGASTIKIDQPIGFSSNVIQNFGFIVMYKWDDGNSLGWDDSSFNMDSIVFTYDSQGSRDIRLYVRDDDGNIDTVSLSLTVNNDNPIINELPDTTISINDSVVFTIMANDPEGIKEYHWDFNGDGIIEDTTTTNSNFYIFPDSSQVINVVVAVLDSFDGISRDTLDVTILQDNPTVNLTGETFHSINDIVQINGTVSEQLGRIVSIEWSIGESPWVASLKTDTTITVPSIQDSNYFCMLRVRDDDGNVAIDTLSLVVVKDEPQVEALNIVGPACLFLEPPCQVKPTRDTIVVVNTQVPMLGFASQVFGSFIVFLWDFDGDGVWDDSSTNVLDTLSIVDTFKVSNEVNTTFRSTGAKQVIFGVLDDDGNLSLDTLEIRVILQNTGAWSLLPISGVNDISISPHNEPHNSMRIWVAGESGGTGGTWVTIDGGNNWEKNLWNGAPGRPYHAIATAGQDSTIIFTASSDGGIVNKTIDGGGFWQEIINDFTLGSVRNISTHPFNSSIAYICFSHNIYGENILRTTNGGANWSNQIGTIQDSIKHLVIVPSDPNTLYLSTWKNGASGGIYKSTDSAESWVNIMTDSAVNFVAVSSTNSSILFAATEGNGIYKSTNSGGSWNQMNNGLNHTIVRALVVDPDNNNNVYAATWEGGVYQSSDGGNYWNQMNDGLSNTYVKLIKIDPANLSILYIATDNGEMYKWE